MAGSMVSYLFSHTTDPQCCGVVGALINSPPSKQQHADPTKRRYTIEEILCEGIELLKNRGYDSAGIFTTAFGNQPKGKLVKYADEGGVHHGSCINRVVEEVLTESGVGTCGIAHTRWATCG